MTTNVTATTKLEKTIGDALTTAHGLRECMVVTGPAGIGKSRAVRSAISGAGVDLVEVRLPVQASRKEVLTAFVAATSTGAQLPRGEFVVLQDQLLTTLARREVVVLIDNAEGLEARALHTLAHLHDDPSSDWTLVLIGLPPLVERLRHEPRLSSCWDVLQLDPLSRRDLITIVRSMDPLLADADKELLVEIDKVLCSGNLHRWERFVRAMRRLVTEYAPDAITLSPELASAAVDEAGLYVLAAA